MCHLVFHASKPRSCAYPKELKTLGDYIRKRRLELGLLQRAVAESIAVSTATVVNWELNRRKPELRYQHKIIAFLGHDPRPGAGAKSLPEQLVAYRLKHGLPQQKLATILRVDTCTISGWECGRSQPPGEYLARIQSLINQ